VSNAALKSEWKHPERETAQDAPAYSPMLVTLSAPLSAGAEAVRALRTHVLGQHVQAGRRAIAICAPSVGVGCSFVAANLAVAIAQVGVKTLLIDGDLRAPTIDQFVRPTTSEVRGLGLCLSEPGSRVGEFIEEDVLPNLSVMYAGAAAANAQELLAREWFERVMNHCMRDYDFTIIDTPPANTFSDARRIGNVAGYGLVVARRNTSLVADVKTLVEQLIDDQVQVIGTIMNAD
jgi:capsular exopolysaccharide synthesis family protein